MTWKPIIVINKHDLTRSEFEDAKAAASFCLGRYFSNLIIILHGGSIFNTNDYHDECGFDDECRLVRELNKSLKRKS